jgi:hypothetical protein
MILRRGERLPESGKCGLEIKGFKMGIKNRSGGGCSDVMWKRVKYCWRGHSKTTCSYLKPVFRNSEKMSIAETKIARQGVGAPGAGELCEIRKGG